MVLPCTAHTLTPCVPFADFLPCHQINNPFLVKWKNFRSTTCKTVWLVLTRSHRHVLYGHIGQIPRFGWRKKCMQNGTEQWWQPLHQELRFELPFDMLCPFPKDFNGWSQLWSIILTWGVKFWFTSSNIWRQMSIFNIWRQFLMSTRWLTLWMSTIKILQTEMNILIPKVDIWYLQ